MKALIDGDIIVYRCASAAAHGKYILYEKGNEEDGPVIAFRYHKDMKQWIATAGGEYTIEKATELEPVSHVYYSINNTIDKIKSALETEEIEVYIGGSSNFRMEVFPEYKAGRPPKPHYYQEARDFLIAQYDAIESAGIEADDSLGILQTGDTCIVTIDKDLDMIPGWHYDYVKDLKYFISPEEGEMNYWKQMFTGDGVDNIRGLDGIGAVKAELLVELLWPDVVKLDSFVRMCYWEQEGSQEAGDRLYEMNEKLIRILAERDDE